MRELAADGEDRAGGARHDVVRRIPFEMGRCAEVACGITNTEDNEVHVAFLGDFDNPLSGISVLDGNFRGIREVHITGHDVIEMMNRFAHGYDMMHGLEQQKAAVNSGYWPLIRYNPALRLEGKNPFQLDSKPPSIPLQQYTNQEARYTMLARSNPEVAKELLKVAQDDVNRQWRVYANRAAMPGSAETAAEAAAKAQPAPAAASNEGAEK